MSHTPLLHHVHRTASISLAGLLALASGAASSLPALAAESIADPCYTFEPGALGAIDHPTAPEAIVLRMFVGGGHVPTEIRFIEQPQFTLYGNDVAIFQPSAQMTSLTDPYPAFQCAQLTADEVDELLGFALGEGGLATAADSYPNPNIVDVPSTIFTIDADGISKTVTVEALGFDMAPEEDLEARAGFSALADLLSDFSAEVDTEQPYHVPGYEGLLSPAWGEPVAEATPWPWTDLTVADFVGDEFERTAFLTPEQVSAVAEIPNGGQVLIPIATPDGEQLSLSIRPLLPGDIVPLVA